MPKPLNTLLILRTGLSNADTWENVIEKSGYNPEYMLTVSQTREYLTRKKVCALVCVHKLPGINALETVQVIGEDNPQLPIIVIMQSPQVEEEAILKQKGARVVYADQDPQTVFNSFKATLVPIAKVKVAEKKVGLTGTIRNFFNKSLSHKQVYLKESLPAGTLPVSSTVNSSKSFIVGNRPEVPKLLKPNLNETANSKHVETIHSTSIKTKLEIVKSAVAGLKKVTVNALGGEVRSPQPGASKETQNPYRIQPVVVETSLNQQSEIVTAEGVYQINGLERLEKPLLAHHKLSSEYPETVLLTKTGVQQNDRLELKPAVSLTNGKSFFENNATAVSVPHSVELQYPHSKLSSYVKLGNDTNPESLVIRLSQRLAKPLKVFHRGKSLTQFTLPTSDVHADTVAVATGELYPLPNTVQKLHVSELTLAVPPASHGGAVSLNTVSEVNSPSLISAPVADDVLFKQLHHFPLSPEVNVAENVIPLMVSELHSTRNDTVIFETKPLADDLLTQESSIAFLLETSLQSLDAGLFIEDAFTLHSSSFVNRSMLKQTLKNGFEPVMINDLGSVVSLASIAEKIKLEVASAMCGQGVNGVMLKQVIPDIQAIALSADSKMSPCSFVVDAYSTVSSDSLFIADWITDSSSIHDNSLTLILSTTDGLTDIRIDTISLPMGMPQRQCTPQETATVWQLPLVDLNQPLRQSDRSLCTIEMVSALSSIETKTLLLATLSEIVLFVDHLFQTATSRPLSLENPETMLTLGDVYDFSKAPFVGQSFLMPSLSNPEMVYPISVTRKQELESCVFLPLSQYSVESFVGKSGGWRLPHSMKLELMSSLTVGHDSTVALMPIVQHRQDFFALAVSGLQMPLPSTDTVTFNIPLDVVSAHTIYELPEISFERNTMLKRILGRTKGTVVPGSWQPSSEGKNKYARLPLILDSISTKVMHAESDGSALDVLAKNAPEVSTKTLLVHEPVIDRPQVASNSALTTLMKPVRSAKPLFPVALVPERFTPKDRHIPDTKNEFQDEPQDELQIELQENVEIPVAVTVSVMEDEDRVQVFDVEMEQAASPTSASLIGESVEFEDGFIVTIVEETAERVRVSADGFSEWIDKSELGL